MEIKTIKNVYFLLSSNNNNIDIDFENIVNQMTHNFFFFSIMTHFVALNILIIFLPIKDSKVF